MQDWTKYIKNCVQVQNTFKICILKYKILLKQIVFNSL